MLYHKVAVRSCSIGFVCKMTAGVNRKVINKAEEARCLKNTPQQLQVAGQVTHDGKAVLMCEYLRSYFARLHNPKYAGERHCLQVNTGVNIIRSVFLFPEGGL